MPVKTRYLELMTKGNSDIIDITGMVKGNIEKTGLHNGIVNIFVPGATAALTTIEFEPGIISDLKELMNELIPETRTYNHNLAWGDGNGHSHLRASFLGPSLTVPFSEGNLLLGTWQQVVLIDFDVRSRSRKLVLQFIGE